MYAMRIDDHDESTGSDPVDADDDGLPVGGKSRPARRYLSIGELLDTLRPEFPDLTLSKIRFLEQQGLLEPERTPSGYRKFFSGQVERLWWILDQQREGYVPLKEIRQRLAAAEAEGIVAPLAPSFEAEVDPRASVHRLQPRVAPVTDPLPFVRVDTVEEAEDFDHEHDEGHDPSLRNAPKEALGESRHPSSVARRVQQAFAAIQSPPTSPGATATGFGAGATGFAPTGATTNSQSANSPATSVGGPRQARRSTDAHVTLEVAEGSRGTDLKSSDSKALRGPTSKDEVPSGTQPAGSQSAGTQSASSRYGASNPLIGQNSGASFTFDELVRASGLEADELRQLESFGLIAGHQVLGAMYYDEDALIAARAANGFKAFGIEPRHMRIYRTMADRESGFLEQIVSPLVHRRQESAKAIAADQLEELITLGTQLRLVALRRLLRASLDSH
jgi:DNA-binding transcriptional MerR regulator